MTDDTTTALQAPAEPLGPSEAEVDSSPHGDPGRMPRPRIRWAGIVWGLAFAALATAGIWLASGEGRVDDLVELVGTVSPATAIGLGILAVGALLLVTGLVGLLRRAQRAVAARSGSQFSLRGRCSPFAPPVRVRPQRRLNCAHHRREPPRE